MTDPEADYNGSIASSVYGSTSSPYDTHTPPGRKVSMPIDQRSSRLVRDSITSFVILGGRELSDEVMRLRLMVGTLSSITISSVDFQTRFATKSKIIGACSRNLWAKLRKDNSNPELILDFFPIIRDYFGILNKHACHSKSLDQKHEKKKSQNNNGSEVKLSEIEFVAHNHIHSISEDIETDDLFHMECGDSSTHGSGSDANSDNIEAIHGRIDAFMDTITALEERLLISSIRSKTSHNINLIKSKARRKSRRAKRRKIIIASSAVFVGIAVATLVLLLLIFVFKVPIF